MENSVLTTWKLKKGEAKRLGSRHPWVFSNQLAHSPKGIEKGAFIELTGDHNEFIAYGYGNPNSLIAFRVLSWDVTERNLWRDQILVDRIVQAWKRRLAHGFSNSFRVVFSEADRLPGLVIDRFQLKDFQVLAFQVLTAGMEKWFSDPLAILEKVVDSMGEDWKTTFVVERKDASIRKMEGLDVFEPRCLRAPIGVNETFLSKAQVFTSSPSGPLMLFADLLNGQKTGFFLDQSLNIQLVQQLLNSRRKNTARILDLCCYVGHWSLQIATALRHQGVGAQVSLVDVSRSSLEHAGQTLAQAGVAFETYEVDVLKEIDKWPPGPFDVVIVDPPAFAKNRKDLPLAEHAYVKLNAEAFRRAAPGALVVSCSCSGLVNEELFSECLSRALRKSGREGNWLLRGGQSLDHPVAPQFPEGRYLKMFVTEVF